MVLKQEEKNKNKKRKEEVKWENLYNQFNLVYDNVIWTGSSLTYWMIMLFNSISKIIKKVIEKFSAQSKGPFNVTFYQTLPKLLKLVGNLWHILYLLFLADND